MRQVHYVVRNELLSLNFLCGLKFSIRLSLEPTKVMHKLFHRKATAKEINHTSDPFSVYCQLLTKVINIILRILLVSLKSQNKYKFWGKKAIYSPTFAEKLYWSRILFVFKTTKVTNMNLILTVMKIIVLLTKKVRNKKKKFMFPSKKSKKVLAIVRSIDNTPPTKNFITVLTVVFYQC